MGLNCDPKGIISLESPPAELAELILQNDTPLILLLFYSRSRSGEFSQSQKKKKKSLKSIRSIRGRPVLELTDRVCNRGVLFFCVVQSSRCLECKSAAVGAESASLPAFCGVIVLLLSFWDRVPNMSHFVFWRFECCLQSSSNWVSLAGRASM